MAEWQLGLLFIATNVFTWALIWLVYHMAKGQHNDDSTSEVNRGDEP